MHCAVKTVSLRVDATIVVQKLPRSTVLRTMAVTTASEMHLKAQAGTTFTGCYPGAGGGCLLVTPASTHH